MQIEPLPKVTFLPVQLTELVIKNWTGETIDFEKNGQICKVYDGYGTCQFKDGHEYKGEIRLGLLWGRGTFKWTDSTVYNGAFKENEITGKGTYTWPDQSTYKGDVLNGLRHGEGQYINEREGVEYNGHWENGMRHGHGELRYKNGSVYSGQWMRGMKFGAGKMVYASENYYEGSWEYNKRNGHGEMHWLSTNERYSGNWKDNLQSGFGTHIWLDSGSNNKLLRNRYVGYWENGLRHGKGTFYYSNGSKYEGDWVENFKHGQGTFTFEDGTEYIGPFDKDRMVKREVAKPDVEEPAPTKGKKNQKDGGAEKVAPESPKTRASNQAKKEVEQNPFRKLIDITDLIDFEQNPAEVEKECQNILLRHNTDLKNWYKLYAKKIEATKSEESFSMTLRQVWRLLRDTHVIAADCSLAQFDRVYNQGRKNHFTLLGASEVNKFDFIYETKDKGSKINGIKERNDDSSSSDEEEEEENLEELHMRLGIEPDDIHSSSKVVLQRQFFEAVVRAASVKYANSSELTTLAQKLDHLFNVHLSPMIANKNKAKSPEEEKQFKVTEPVFEEYDAPLRTVFKYFSKRQLAPYSIRQDITLEVSELLNLLQKSKLIDAPNSHVTTEEVIAMIERYYTPGTRLNDKLTEEKFQVYVKENPLLLPVNQEIEAWKERMAARQARIEEIEKKKAEVAAMDEDAEKPVINEDVPAEESEMEDEMRRERIENEKVDLQASWRKKVISEHLIFIKGVEIVYFEFKEIVLALASHLRQQVDPTTGKLRVVLTKFIEEWLLRRLQSFVKFQIPTRKAQTDASRQWPESTTDAEIRANRAEGERIQELERKKQAEREQVEMEIRLMAEEDVPAMDQKEIEEIQRKRIEQEEAARRAREAEEEGDEEESADDSDEDDEGDDDSNNDNDN